MIVFFHHYSELFGYTPFSISGFNSCLVGEKAVFAACNTASLFQSVSVYHIRKEHHVLIFFPFMKNHHNLVNEGPKTIRVHRF